MTTSDADSVPATEQPVVLCVPAEWADAGPTAADIDRLAELGVSHLWLRDGGTPIRPVEQLPWLADWACVPGRGLIVDRTLPRERRRLGGQPFVVASWQGSEVDLVALAAGGDDQLLRQASSFPVIRMGLRQALLDRQADVLAEAAGLCKGTELVWLDGEVRQQAAAAGELLLASSLVLSLPGVPCFGWVGQHGTDEGPVASWPVGLAGDELAVLAERIGMRRTLGLAGRRCEVVDTRARGAGVMALRYELDEGALVVTNDLDARSSTWQVLSA
jgi:hypothetical protein